MIRARAAVAAGAFALGLALLGSGVPSTAAAATKAADATATKDVPATRMYLVTLNGPGTAGGDKDADRLLARQAQVLADAGAGEPTYSWTTALNGFAVELTRPQARTLRADPRVSVVEADSVRRLAGAMLPRTTPQQSARQSTQQSVRQSAQQSGAAGSGPRAGKGTVIGFIDSGIDTDSPVFADPGGAVPGSFSGECETGPGFAGCDGKVVGARWFVDGFGAARVASSSALSPLDDSGHGTAMASLAAGNGAVSARAAGESLGTFSGVAPAARIAAYKACWTAPDPADDGCSSADLVSAIDRASADGVDVLNLSVGGTGEIDTVERALLGAAEAGIVVVAAAGNDGRSAFSAHAAPWVTTVGGSVGRVPGGRVSVSGGPALDGSMASTRRVSGRRIVLAARAGLAGTAAESAAMCLPGTLDAARVRGRIVVCERGLVGRVDKSAAVALAEGAGMVLVDRARADTAVDVHAVPTVHLRAAASRRLLDHLARHPGARARLVPLGPLPGREVLPSSSSGDAAGLVVKPDLVAPAAGQLAAVPPGAGGDRFGYVSGTSAATARVSGLAATLAGAHRWSESLVRSALTTSARGLGAPALRQGAGQASPAALRSRLALDVDAGDYRRMLTGRLGYLRLNTASVLTSGRSQVVTRRITNVAGRAMYFSSSARGFRHHQVSVTPAAVRLAPGASATFRIRIGGGRVRPLDDGVVTWRSGDERVTRIPVVLAR